MDNPWLSLPLEDYEWHMNSPEVQQLRVLSDLFAEVLAICRPASVAILGVAGGNGLDRIDPWITKRIVGLDVNPIYLDAVRRRYSHLRGLELHCIDLAAERFTSGEPVQLVHAALVFEHAGTGRCLDNAEFLVSRKGVLSVVIQLPAPTGAAVGVSPFPSMRSLESHFSFVDRDWLGDALAARTFRLNDERFRALPAGKAFWMGVFQRE